MGASEKKIIIRLLLVVLALLALINLLGAFMPELGFDALWYHLTLPKLWLFKHQWYFPGGLLYYSAMPRLMETIFIPLVKISGYIGPKILMFLFGLGTSYLIFRLINKFTHSNFWSLIGASLFYATWLVSWQSSSAYVDLGRTFFETSALYLLINPPRRFDKTRSLIFAGILLGLAVGTKWLALGSVVIYSLLFSPALLGIALAAASPWFIIAYHFTGSPIFPLGEPFMTFTQLSQVDPDFHSPLQMLTRIFTSPYILSKPYDDFLSPLLGIILLFSLLALSFRNKKIKKISLLSLLGLIYFLITPPPSSRYFLPYLPSLVISGTYVASHLKPHFARIFVIGALFSALLILSLRIYSFTKYMPLFAHRDVNKFLASQSHRLPDTFIDTDNFVRENLSKSDKILIDRLHNLYYFPYDFDHTSWSFPNQKYDYLVTRDEDPRSIDGILIHTNSLGIQVFKLN